MNIDLIFTYDLNKFRPIESCQKWKDSVSQQIDLAFNLFFMIYFFIRVSLINVDLY